MHLGTLGQVVKQGAAEASTPVGEAKKEAYPVDKLSPKDIKDSCSPMTEFRPTAAAVAKGKQVELVLKVTQLRKQRKPRRV